MRVGAPDVGTNITARYRVRPFSLARAFLRAVATAAVAASLVFLLFSVLPTDPARAALGANASAQAVENLRREMGLDEPIHRRFEDFLASGLTLEFGKSFVTRRSVGPDIMRAAMTTLSYAWLALFLGVVYSLTTANAGYFLGHRVRRAIAAVNGAATAVPSLVMAIGLGTVFVALDLFRFIEPIGLRRAVMAAAVLAVYPGATLSQILSAELEKLRGASFVKALRSHGHSEWHLVRSTMQRLALLPWLTQLTNTAAGLIAGAAVVEIAFSIPGIGRLVVQSVLRADLPMVQAIVLLVIVSFVILDQLSELAYRRFA